MSLFRAVPASHPATNGQPQRARHTVRLPKNVPYIVDNLWEHLRPEAMPCRRHAVYASPTPALARQNISSVIADGEVAVYEVVIEGAYKMAQLRVEDARCHGDIAAVQDIFQASIASLLAASVQERQLASPLFMPGCSKQDWARAVQDSQWAARFAKEASRRSTFWSDAVTEPMDSRGELFYELGKGASYRLLGPVQEIGMSYSFFEALAIADQERIHSQMITWMLTPSAVGGPLNARQRRALLSTAFAFETSVEACEALVVMTEVKSLDIVVFANDGLLVVENKLKSRQSAEQLPHYDEAIRGLLNGHPHVRHTTKRFLTFTGEEAITDGWLDMDYRRLLSGLVALNADNVYVRAYIVMLERLLDHRDVFLNDHVQHARVFTRSGMASADRIDTKRVDDETGVERYTFQNRLERAFCEALLTRAASKLGPGPHRIEETHGQALIDTLLFRVETTDGRRYNCGLQLQGATVKLNIGAVDYLASTREELRPIEARLDASMADVRVPGLPDTRLRPNAGRSKAYRSWTYALPGPERLDAAPLDQFVQQHNMRLQWGAAVWNTVLLSLKDGEFLLGFDPV